MKKEINTIFKARVGSHLYGLNTPESDEDFVGVFMPGSEELLGLKTVDEISQSTKASSEKRQNNSEDIDDKQYSLHKFLGLALPNNPNIVELLFVNPENTLICSPEFQELILNRDKIISSEVYYSFSGYAHAQKRKLVTKRERFLGLREGLSWFSSNIPSEGLHDLKSKLMEEEAQELNSLLKYYKGKDGNTQSFHSGMPIKVIYELLSKEYDQYGWRVRTKTFETLLYDQKFAYHLLRLQIECVQLLETGKLEFPFQGEDYKILRKIRNAEIGYDELMNICADYEKKCEKAFMETKLPRNPDRKWANDWLIKVSKKAIMSENV